MSNRNFSYIFSPSLLWGNVSSQSVTGLCNLKSLSAWAIIGAVSVRESVFNNNNNIIDLYNRPIDAAISW